MDVRVVRAMSGDHELAEGWEACRRRGDLPRSADRLDELALRSGEHGTTLDAAVALDPAGRLTAALPVLARHEAKPWRVRTPGATRTVASFDVAVAEAPCETVLGSQDRAVADALVAEVVRCHRRADVLTFPAVRVGSTLHQALAASGERMLLRGTSKSRLLCRLGDDLDAYLAGTGSAKHRSALRRDRRRATEQGLHVRRLRRLADVPDLVAHAEQVWSRSWHGTVGGSHTGGWDAQLRKDAGRHRLRAYLLAAGDEPCAFLWATAADGVLRIVKMAFDPRWRALSPGRLLVLSAIEDAHHEGSRVVDFGYGDHPYKRRWANDRVEVVELNLVRRAPRALLAYAPPAGYAAVRGTAVRALTATGAGDAARRFSSRRLGR